MGTVLFTPAGYVRAMDALVVGALTALTAIVGVFWWQLLVRPEAMLQGWGEPGEEGWFEHHPGAVRALRFSAGGLLFLLGFVTGLALTFLVRTG